MDKLKVRALRRFRVRDRVVEAHEVIALEPGDAVNVIGGGIGLPLDAEAYATALRALNEQAVRACPLPRWLARLA
jgi:hypothetical protein